VGFFYAHKRIRYKLWKVILVSVQNARVAQAWTFKANMLLNELRSYGLFGSGYTGLVSGTIKPGDGHYFLIWR